MPLLRLPRREHLPQLPRLPAGEMVARQRRETQTAPFRLGAVWVRGASVSGQTGGGAGDVSPPVQGESCSDGANGGSGGVSGGGPANQALMLVTQWITGSAVEQGRPSASAHVHAPVLVNKT